MRYLFPALVLALTAPPSLSAQVAPPEVDALFSWTSAETPGCACAVSRNGTVVFNKAYGSADLERSVPLTPSSVFDAASITKQFVAAAVLLLEEEGKLALTDDIRKFIPELPDYGSKITIDQLLTHTSGLRDWTGLQPLAESDADALTLILRQKGLNFLPGEEWSYSNSGYVLLKELVRRVSGTPFSAFAQQRLFGPLGMKSTRYADDLRSVVKQRALAYEKTGTGWRLEVKLDDDRGGGGALLSIPTDLLLWNEALQKGTLGKGVTGKLQEPARLNNGRRLDYARGLFLGTNRGSRVIWHTGGSAGYGSMLARFPEQGLSIAVMCNSGETGDRQAVVRTLYELYAPAGAAAAVPPAAKGADTAGLDLGSKAGVYLHEKTGEPLRLAVNGGRLSIAGGPALTPDGKGAFRNPSPALSYMSGDSFAIRFPAPDILTWTTMEGASVRYRRAEGYAPAEDGLKAFSGRYRSGELRATFEVLPGKGGITVRLNERGDRTLTAQPVAPDVFTAGRMVLRFLRDASGRVVGMKYSNPVLRNVRFERTAE